MKPIIYLCLLAGLFACGQKGPLFLADEAQPQEKPTVAIDNPNAKIQPDFIRFKALTVSGQSAELSQNTAAGWEAVLMPLDKSNNLIRYAIFNRALTSSTPTFAMLIGHVQNKTIKGQRSQTISAGDYLRFRGLERGADQIPTLLNRINEYFANNPRIQHGKNKDFLIENQGNIDIYVSVEKTQ